MKARLLTIATLWLTYAAAPATGLAATENYNIDPAHTSVVFSVSHNGQSFVYGLFRQVQGQYQLDQIYPANSRFRVSIPVESLDTNNAERDKHLRSADFFNSQQFPTITFDSTSVTQSRSGNDVAYEITGNLTMHGVTRQVTIPLKLLDAGPGLRNDYRTGFWGQLELKRSDFDMNNLLNIVGDKIGITVSFEGIRQDAAAGQPLRPQQ
jgi:polyisoprenoid-binding protein YceI